MRNIPFSPPDMTELEIQEVAEALRSGWITTGPKTKKFERQVIGCGHPVGASGARMFLDIYKQVSGKAGNYQIKKEDELPRNAMMLNIGGTATTNYVFIVGR